MTNVFLPAFGRCDPMVLGPRRIVPYVSLMTTFQFSNPLQVFIQMKAYNLSRLSLKWLLWAHNVPTAACEFLLRQSIGGWDSWRKYGGHEPAHGTFDAFGKILNTGHSRLA